MTLRLEAYFEDQLRPILSGYKSQGKRNVSKNIPRTAKRRVPPVTIKVVGGRAIVPQTAGGVGGGGSRRSSPALPSGLGSGGLYRRPPRTSSPASMPPPAASRKSGGGKTGPRIKSTLRGLWLTGWMVVVLVDWLTGWCDSCCFHTTHTTALPT